MTFEAPAASSTAAHDETQSTGATPRRLCIIYNPTAGGAKGRRLWRTVDLLRAKGCALDLRETRQRGDAEAFAAACDPATSDALVVAGGDGTVNEVINGMLRRPADQRPPLGVIPSGTANVLALDIGQKLTPQAIAATLASGSPRRVHLAQVSKPDQDRCFLLMAGAGFDAHVVDSVRLGLKRHTGKLAYVVETLAQAFHYPFPTIEGTLDGTPFAAATVVICKGRLYGGPFVAAPQASLEDPALYAIVMPRKGLWAVLRYAAALGMGRIGSLPDVEIRPFQTMTLQAPQGAAFQADGDVISHLPLTIAPATETVLLLWPDK
jgi:YegS/Rv2252/BmrU family lipid kinase